MSQKIPKIVFLAILSLAFFNLNFEIVSSDFFSAGYAEKPSSLVSKIQAKKKPKKKRKNNIGKLSKESNTTNFQNPIIVVGDNICRKNSEEALRILFDKDREGFDFVASRLGKIECAVSGSGVFPWENPTRFKAGVAISNAETAWYAGVLVHESCHIEQFKIEAEYSGEKAEIACLGAQLGSLKKLEASQKKIDYVANIAESRYWLVDINERWW